MPASLAYAPPTPAKVSSNMLTRARSHLAAPGALALGLAAWDPTRRGGPPLCPYRLFTGHSCPGCGLTRGVGSLLRGRWHEAITMHPLAPVLVMQAAAFCVAFVLFGAGARTRLPTWLITSLVALNTIAFLAIWVARTSTGQIAVLG